MFDIPFEAMLLVCPSWPCFLTGCVLGCLSIRLSGCLSGRLSRCLSDCLSRCPSLVAFLVFLIFGVFSEYQVHACRRLQRYHTPTVAVYVHWWWRFAVSTVRLRRGYLLDSLFSKLNLLIFHDSVLRHISWSGNISVTRCMVVIYRPGPLTAQTFILPGSDPSTRK